MAREITDGLYIDLEYYTPEDYYVYVAEAEVVLDGYIAGDYFVADYFETNGSEFALTCDLTEVVGEVKEFNATLNAQATLNCVPTKIIDLTEADIEGGAGLVVEATLSFKTMIGVRIVGVDATMNAQFTQSVDGTKVVGIASALNSNFTVSATPARTRGFGAGLNASASITCVNYRIRPFETDFDTAFSASIAVDITARGLFQADAAFTQSTTAVKTTDVDATLATQSTLSATALRIKALTSTLNSVTTLTTTPVRTVDAIANPSAQFTQTATAQRFVGFNSTLSAQFTLTATGEDLDLASATLAAQFALTASSTITADAASTLNSVATLTTTPTVIAADWNPKSWIIGVEGDTNNSYRPVTTLLNNGTLYELYQRTIDDTPSNYDGFLLVSRDAEDGSVNWDQVYNGPESSLVVPRLFLDGSELVVAVYSNLPAFVFRGSILRIDASDGSINSNTNNNTGLIQDFDVDSSGNVYTLALALYNNGTNLGQTAVVKKFNSSGVQQWAKYIERVNQAIYFPLSLVLAHNSIFISFNAGAVSDTYVWKMSTTDGSVQLQKESNTQFIKMFADSSGNLYTTGWHLSSDYTVISKLDSTLTAEWSWRSDHLSIYSDQYIGQILQDSDDYYYIALRGPNNSEKQGALKVSEYLGVPTIEWQTEIVDHDSGNIPDFRNEINSVAISQSHVYMTGFSQQNDYIPITFTNKIRKSDGAAFWDNIDFTADTTRTNSWSYISKNDITLTTTSTPIIRTSNPLLTIGDWTGVGNTAAVFLDASTVDHYQWVYGVFGFQLVNSQFGFSVTGTRVFSLTETLPMVSTLSAAPTVQRDLVATTLDSAFTLELEPTRILQFASTLNSEATATINATKLLDAIIPMSSAFTLTVDAVRTRDTDATLDAQTTQTALVGVIKPLDVQFDTAFTAIMDVNITARPLVYLETQFTQAVDAVKTTDITQNYSTQATLSVDYDKIVGFDSSLSSAFTQTATGEVIRAVGADLDSAFSATIDTTDSRTARIDATLDSAFTLSEDSTRIRIVDSTLDSEFALSIVPTKLVDADATLNGVFDHSFIAGVRVDLTLELTGFFSTLTAGKVINIDPFRTIIVQQETRLAQVLPENRTITVEQETRVNTLL